MRRSKPQFHIKWWRIISWLYLISLLLYGIYTIATNLRHW
ncbi:hypothetical protein PB1A_0319 [Leuconostoc inhae]|uniref:Uncharacterized protein n=2 Tax=Leuconostoc TaxID=1243 RepID=A0AAN2UG17_9LACO|nr:hypothetical protein LEGAS_1252 [Leuconostoc gasicomitatum LMG 18811]CUR63928.1 Uncharacterized protein LEKG_1341 [Leuconostoc gasicomitatum KG16-1]CUW03801.1 hypothetical protein C122C_1873 [Leuconostoc gasicomitatum]CUW07838.1 hypothetical protein PB1A_0319 [Leuconostoc inhae]CUW12925.1 hypothetical protein PL111_0429 [Leuconostoc inhae]